MEKKLSFVWIQNDKILVIFQYLQQFQDYWLLLGMAQVTQKIFGCRSS